MLNILKEKSERILSDRRLMFLMFAVYYAGRTGSYTAFVTQWPVTDKGFMLLRLLGAMYFGIQTVRIFLHEVMHARHLSGASGRRIQGANILFAVLVASLCVNFIVQGGYTFIADIMSAYVMSYVSLRDNIKLRTFLCFAVCLFIMFLCSAGILSNLTNTRGNTVRYALGFDYTTRLSGIFGFAVLYCCYLKKFSLEWKDILMIVFSALFINFLTDTRTYFYMELLLALIAVLKKTGTLRKLICPMKAAEKLFVFLIPVSFALPVFLTLAYGQGGIFMKLDKILSHRLSQVYADCVNYSIQFFGHDFRMYGNGGQHVDITDVFGSNFVDAGILQLLLIRGVIPFIAIAVMTYLAFILMYRRKMHYEILLGFIIVMLSTFSAGFMSNESVLFIMMFYGVRKYARDRGKEGLYDEYRPFRTDS